MIKHSQKSLGEAVKKISSANGQAIKSVVGKGRAIKKKSFLKTKKVPMAINIEDRGGKALMAWPLVEELFIAASLIFVEKKFLLKRNHIQRPLEGVQMYILR